MCDFSATYSPDDNKLRLYASTRLDKETFERVKAAGFRWAPKQELFVAPSWSPIREDLLIELAGEIEDEDTTLTERAEQRAERFEDYTEKRQRDAKRASDGVHTLADNIPFGQPILVGHHSERAARRDAKRIENGMRKAVKCWETAEYWTRRAAGALQNAKYKERADVRARRICRLEADLRKVERNRDSAAKGLQAWSKEGLTYEQALHVANFNHLSASFPLAKYPRELPASQYEGPTSLWSALNDHIVTLEQACGLAVGAYVRFKAWAERWTGHYQNRLAYERAMLDEQGGTVATRTAMEQGGAVRCWASPGYGRGWSYIKRVNKISVTVSDAAAFGGRIYTRTIKHDDLAAVMTAADVAQARDEGRLTETEDGTGFFLTGTTTPDDKPATEATGDSAPAEAAPAAPTETATTDAQAIGAMREQLRAGGVTVEVAPLLYPTPRPLAEHMVMLAQIRPGMTLLEPSAGTCVLLHAARTLAPGVITTAIELDYRLASRLRLDFDDVRQADFLQCDRLGPFDRVLINPPFNRGADVAHIEHAFAMLRSGGRLVAICANGPKQGAILRPLVEATGGSWEDLPDGSFQHAGTNVRTALVVLNAP